jgi:hypothetical protein
MKGLLFLGTVILVLLVAAIGLSKTTTEGFQPQIPSPAPQIIVPKVDPKPAVLELTSPAPYLPPVEKTYGPAYGDIARVNTLPYKDPTLEAAPYKRIEELRESLAAFFTYESKSLEQQSDPAVQLPLMTARGDLQRLTDEVAVLKRNPGIDSSLTQGQVDDIQANLAYLQRKHRLSVNALSGIDLKEGFESGSPNTTDETDGMNGNTSPRATPDELKTALEKIMAEIVRMSASGSTDPVLQSRLDVLNKIKNDIEDIIREVESGVRQPTDIPILTSDLENFLPIMGDPNDPLPTLIRQANLPPTIANLVPQIAAGNANSQDLATTVLQNYGDAIFKGLSWNVHLGYTPQNMVDLAKARASESETKNLQFHMSAVNPINGQRYDFGDPQVAALPRGEMEAVTDAIDAQRPMLRGAGLAPSVSSASASAAFDWKARAGQICDSIRKRGMNPADFGCLPPNAKVSSDYSWRGLTRMICTRLLTTLDPGLPETCGCPPVEWPGWRS